MNVAYLVHSLAQQSKTAEEQLLPRFLELERSNQLLKDSIIDYAKRLFLHFLSSCVKKNVLICNMGFLTSEEFFD